MGAIVEHGDPQQRGEREYRGHLHPPAGHPDSERPGAALPPRDPHRRARDGTDLIAGSSGELGVPRPVGLACCIPARWGQSRLIRLLRGPRRRGLLLRAGRQRQAGSFLRFARFPRCLFMRRGTLFKRGAEDKRGGWAPPSQGRAGCGVGPWVAECVEGERGKRGSALLAAWVLCELRGKRAHEGLLYGPKWGPDK